MREGQAVTLVADAYPSVEFRGKVSTIAPATKAEFSLLPAQNSSGNWVKVVQRVPVLIAIAPERGQPQLRAGMTVTARVDTGHERSLAGLMSFSSASPR
jgi:membrane fusion protein (multidrug efflux system)